MKTIKKAGIISLMLLAFSTFSTNANAQTEKGKEKPKCTKEMHKCSIPNLTDDQKAQIETLKVPFMKDMGQLKNKLAEKKAHLKTVSQTDNPDMNEINKTIDEMTGLMNQMMKKKAAHEQDVRNILTDEQKVAFDKLKEHRRGMKRGFGGHKPMGEQHKENENHQ